MALVHHPTLDRRGRVVTTAVTTLDVHDLARLARTYGLDGVTVVTPLAEQRALVGRLLAHWISGKGAELNPCRREALRTVRLAATLEEAAGQAADRWGERPVRVGTSARSGPGRPRVGFGEARARLARERRPALLVLGTGWGLAPEALAGLDWTLAPLGGADGYNHLSVRSAASILVDRLFGEG
ncbi:MAG: RNA methyltransferase [Deferrisomatales bacterium]